MKTNKQAILSILCLVLIFMGIGFALFSSTLNIIGSSKTSGTFDVKITNVELDSNNKSSGSTNTTPAVGSDYAVTETTLSATFNAPGDYITYNITVTNRGTIDAVIDVETHMLDSTDSFELSCDVRDGTELQANGGHTTFPCMIKFKESVESLENTPTANMRVSLKAVQKASYQIKYVDQENSCFISVVPGEINFYDVDNPECGSEVDIPNGLRLPVRTITSYSYSNEKCLANAGGIADSRDMPQSAPSEICEIVENEIESSTINEILNSDLAMYVDYELGDEGTSKYLITKIGAGAFETKNVSSVYFSTSITEIGTSAFQQTALTSLTLPPNITKIGNLAFWRTPISGTLTFPKSITELGNATFELNNIENVIFDSDSSLTDIPERCFNRNGVSSIVFPLGIESIGRFAISENELTSLDLSNYTSLKTIGTTAFSSGKITTINFGGNSSVESIGSGAFSYNSLTGPLVLPKSLKTIERIAFAMGNNKITALSFEAGSQIETIQSNAFRANSIGGTLILPDSLKSLSGGAFAQNKLEELYIGSGLTKIGVNAFANNKINNVISLLTITINMTQNEWNTNVQYMNTGDEIVESAAWYSGSPTINYNS